MCFIRKKVKGSLRLPWIFFNPSLVDGFGSLHNYNATSKDMVVSETFTESYGTPPSSEGKPSQQIDVTFIVGPVIYGIVHTPSGKVYYGETEELVTRLNRHWKRVFMIMALCKLFGTRAQTQQNLNF